jgi:hypothetical protein
MSPFSIKEDLMNLNLTCSNPANMTDTNKLLYLIYGEVQQIRQVLDTANLDSLLKELGQDDTISQPEPQNVTTGQIELTQSKEGLKCKYCGEIVTGNRGNLLAHIRKCPKRTKEGE